MTPTDLSAAASSIPVWCRLRDGRTPGLVACDLDGTLIAEDSQERWYEWLIAHGAAGSDLEQLVREMNAEYAAGTLDLPAAIARAVASENRLSPAERHRELAQFVKAVIEPARFSQALRFLAAVQAAGLPLVIISATCSFVVRAAAASLGVLAEAVIAVDLEETEGRFTGRILGTPSFQAGKIVRLQAHLDERNASRPADAALSLSDVFFLTDSANDLPLVQAAGGAALVNPDEALLAYGRAHALEVLAWRPVSSVEN